MTLSETHKAIIIEAAKQIPSPWQQRFASNVVDALFGQSNLSDDDIREACKAMSWKMEMSINL